MHELDQPVAVVCHDAGAANILLAAMQADPSGRYLPVMEGPAARLWHEAGKPGGRLFSLAEALSAARSVLSGTGWASTLEHDARREARARGLSSAALIDHWVNYEARFERHGERILPDEFWVTDDDALRIAAQCFPGARIRQIPNLYLQKLVEAVAPLSPLDAGNLLYVLEPIRISWPGTTQPGEFEALDYLAGNIGKIAGASRARIRLRPHPSDPPGKYHAWLARQHGLDVAMDSAPTLAEAISRAEWVAGCETMALVVALAAGRKTVCSLPPQAPECRLPHQGLVHLREL